MENRGRSTLSESSIVGCILGTAVGDALGLPYEGVSLRRAPRLLGAPTRYRFLFGRGMVSDDTEHTCLVSQALIASGDDADEFSRAFAKGLRWWFAGLPAGIGRATARSCIKLWFGFPPTKSGVYSAGNGPAMRSAILGAVIDDPGRLARTVHACTTVTHTDPKAEAGAAAIAAATQISQGKEQVTVDRFLERFHVVVQDAAGELTGMVESLCQSVRDGETTADYAQSIGCKTGVSGYTYQTVPVCLHAWLSYPDDYRTAVTEVILCGGDADTTAAIVGGIVGARVGREGIPEEWLRALAEWPRSVSWMERLGEQLQRRMETGERDRPVRLNPIAVFARNLFFLAVVLVHGMRRLAPPY